MVEDSLIELMPVLELGIGVPVLILNVDDPYRKRGVVVSAHGTHLDGGLVLWRVMTSAGTFREVSADEVRVDLSSSLGVAHALSQFQSLEADPVLASEVCWRWYTGDLEAEDIAGLVVLLDDLVAI